VANDRVLWFAQYKSIDGATHRFGVGVALGVASVSRIGLILGETRDAEIVFYETQWGNENHRYLSVYSPLDFKIAAETQPSATSEAEKSDSEAVQLFLQRALVHLDEAFESSYHQRGKTRKLKPMVASPAE
jgi:hypothetical protein